MTSTSGATGLLTRVASGIPETLFISTLLGLREASASRISVRISALGLGLGLGLDLGLDLGLGLGLEPVGLWQHHRRSCFDIERPLERPCRVRARIRVRARVRVGVGVRVRVRVRAIRL